MNGFREQNETIIPMLHRYMEPPICEGYVADDRDMPGRAPGSERSLVKGDLQRWL